MRTELARTLLAETIGVRVYLLAPLAGAALGALAYQAVRTPREASP